MVSELIKRAFLVYRMIMCLSKLRLMRAVAVAEVPVRTKAQSSRSVSAFTFQIIA